MLYIKYVVTMDKKLFKNNKKMFSNVLADPSHVKTENE